MDCFLILFFSKTINKICDYRCGCQFTDVEKLLKISKRVKFCAKIFYVIIIMLLIKNVGNFLYKF